MKLKTLVHSGSMLVAVLVLQGCSSNTKQADTGSLMPQVNLLSSRTLFDPGPRTRSVSKTTPKVVMGTVNSEAPPSVGGTPPELATATLTSNAEVEVRRSYGPIFLIVLSTLAIFAIVTRVRRDSRRSITKVPRPA